MHGLEHEVRNAITLIMDLDIVKARAFSAINISSLTVLLGFSPRNSLPD